MVYAGDLYVICQLCVLCSPILLLGVCMKPYSVECSACNMSLHAVFPSEIWSWGIHQLKSELIF